MNKRFLSLLLVPMLLGGGCAAKQSTKTPDVKSLRQPAPPPAPQKAPEIPPEARKVPRPY